jgi:transcriptional regulator with XRE-family HTH domain
VKKSIYKKEYKFFVQVFTEYRTKAGLLQVDLAKKLGVPQSYISKIETGQRKVDIIELREICTHLKITLAEFVTHLEKEINAKVLLRYTS